MCLECVQQLDPPTPEVAQGRLFLQLLAAGLFIVSLFAMLAGQGFAIFLMVILGIILYMSWSEFSHMMALNFFLICVYQSILAYVQVILVIEYYDQLTNQNAAEILFLIVRVIYFPTAVFFSHEAYKRFKQYAYNYTQSQVFGDYQMMATVNQSPNTSQNQSQRQDNQGNRMKTFMPFSGQAVSLG